MTGGTPYAASLRLACDSAEQATWLAASIGPELTDGPDGSTATVRIEGAELCLDLAAVSLADLRALVNNLVRLLEAARQVAPAHGKS